MPDIIHEDEYAALVAYADSHPPVSATLAAANLTLSTLTQGTPQWGAAMQIIWTMRDLEENPGGPPPLQE